MARGPWPAPLTFGECGACAYKATGPVHVCWECASRVVEAVPTKRCSVCEQACEDGECGNPICNFSGRRFDRNHAIAMRTGPLKLAINRYKYQNMFGWAGVFARVLVGFLEKNRAIFQPFDLITASPTFVDPGGVRQWDHTRRVLEEAAKYTGDAWPLDVGGPPAITKLRATTPMTTGDWQARHQIATTELRTALHVPTPERTRGKTILVYDDVFTDGHTLNEVARCLRQQGRARAVSGMTLARQPWKGL